MLRFKWQTKEPGTLGLKAQSQIGKKIISSQKYVTTNYDKCFEEKIKGPVWEKQ